MEENAIIRFKIIAIGGSAGSLDTVLRIFQTPDLPVSSSYVVVIHRKNDPSSILSELISARTYLPVKEVEDKEPISPGTIYIAPSDYHLLIEDEKTFSLDSSEKVHHSRPSIDVTFESLAEIFGDAVIGILLSGANADGAEGLRKIRDAGGYTIVQNPATSEVGYMPQQAINLKAAVEVTDATIIPDTILRLTLNAER